MSFQVRVCLSKHCYIAVYFRDSFDRGMSPDSMDETHVRIDVTDTTDTEVDEDYKRKRQYMGKLLVPDFTSLSG